MSDESSIPYQMLPDQAAKVREYRVYWVLGKVALGIVLLIAVAFSAANPWAWFVPISLMVGLIWPGFPAFCRCPYCKKRMKPREKDARLAGPHRLTRHYLTCDACKVYLYLGTSSKH